jgi:predicted nucleotidyltransferase
MDEKLMNVLRDVRRELEADGFQLLGVFGSRARGDNRANSDLDILYQLQDRFYDRYPGWESIGRLEEIREELSRRTGLPVDLANRGALHEVGKKYILPETVYVA